MGVTSGPTLVRRYVGESRYLPPFHISSDVDLTTATVEYTAVAGDSPGLTGWSDGEWIDTGVATWRPDEPAGSYVVFNRVTAGGETVIFRVCRLVVT